MDDDSLVALTRHAVETIHAAVARQERWYTLNAAVTAQAVNQLRAGATGPAGDAFLRSVAAALSALDPETV